MAPFVIERRLIMSKFNVGDKVKIVRCIGNGGLSLEDRLLAVGEEYVIESVNPNCLNPCRDNYGLVGRSFVVYDVELELVEPKQFTKSDLKDGMVVEHRDGDRYMVFGNCFISPDGNWDATKYNDDLTSNTDSMWRHDYDICRVYKVSSGIYMDFKDIFNDEKNYVKLIWERKEEPKHKEMTVAEIEKELGYKIKVVGDTSCQK